jgi:hypothetical protein
VSDRGPENGVAIETSGDWRLVVTGACPVFGEGRRHSGRIVEEALRRVGRPGKGADAAILSTPPPHIVCERVWANSIAVTRKFSSRYLLSISASVWLKTSMGRALGLLAE